MSSSNCCFLTCIQVSQEAGQVVWYSHLFQNFPQFIVIHTVKDFGIVNKAEIDVFLELLLFRWSSGYWQLVPLPFLKPSWTSGSSLFTYCWSLAWRILSITISRGLLSYSRIFEIRFYMYPMLCVFRRLLCLLSYHQSVYVIFYWSRTSHPRSQTWELALQAQVFRVLTLSSFR